MRGFISFFLVLLFVIALVIFLFIILLQSTSQIPAIVSEEIKLMESGFLIKNVNSLLASKTMYVPYVYVPIIDLMIAANFADIQYIKSYANSTINRTMKDYINKNLSFGYCTSEECYNCKVILTYPTKYGNFRMCQVDFSSITAVGTLCEEK